MNLPPSLLKAHRLAIEFTTAEKIIIIIIIVMITV